MPAKATGEKAMLLLFWGDFFLKFIMGLLLLAL
jgi:hypothetical protein